MCHFSPTFKTILCLKNSPDPKLPSFTEQNTGVCECSSFHYTLRLSYITSNKPLSTERWSLYIKLEETCCITGTLCGTLLFANSYPLWKKRWACVLLRIRHSSFIEHITIRRPPDIPQCGRSRILRGVSRCHDVWFILHENNYLVRLCRL